MSRLAGLLSTRANFPNQPYRMVHGVAVVREYASLVRYTTFRCIPAAVDHGVVVYGRFFFFLLLYTFLEVMVWAGYYYTNDSIELRSAIARITTQKILGVPLTSFPTST